MKLLRKAKRASITVIVTLLIIPSILLSGTAVDISRIYAARSTLSNANHLALNSVLTQYNALLKDLYGLYGVMQDDPVLGEMVNEYIMLSILGADWQERGLGTFDLFYGGNIQFEATHMQNQHLGRTEVLRNQIEEYMKIRGPVIIVSRLIGNDEMVDTMRNVQRDSGYIQQKLDIDAEFEALISVYREIYLRIVYNDNFPYNYENMLEFIHSSFYSLYETIQQELEVMHRLRFEYEEAIDALLLPIQSLIQSLNNSLGAELNTAQLSLRERTIELRGDASAKVWDALQVSTQQFLVELWTFQDRVHNLFIAVGDEVPIGVESVLQHAEELESAVNELLDIVRGFDHSVLIIESSARLFNNNLNRFRGRSDGDYFLNLQDERVLNYKDNIDRLASVSEIADSKADSLRQKIEDLRNSDAPDELKATLIDYEELIQDPIRPMIEILMDNREFCDDVIEALYPNNFEIISADAQETVYTFMNIRSNEHYKIDFLITYNSSTMTDRLAMLVLNANDVMLLTHFPDINDWNLFADFNPAMYETLHNFFKNYSYEILNEERERIGDATQAIQSIFRGLSFTTEGASRIPFSDQSGNQRNFGTDDNWNSAEETRSNVNSSMNMMGDFFFGLLDKALLVTYSVEMFSMFTDRMPDSDTIPRTSITGVPMDTTVNYFFRAEQEYLIIGSNNKYANLTAVAGMLLLTRFVINYMCSFKVNSVRVEITSLSAAAGPFAPIIRELLRIVYAMGESVIDVNTLRGGGRVPILKNDSNWQFSIISGVTRIPQDVANRVANEITGNSQSGETGITYADYLLLFLLLVNSDTLTQRIGNLISLNITNYRGRDAHQGDGARMQAEMNRVFSEGMQFRMEHAHTAFTIQTSADVRMLFLSLGWAQNDFSLLRGQRQVGVTPPTVVNVNVIEARGY